MVILHVTPTMDPKAGGVCQAVKTMIKYATSAEVAHEVLCLDQPDAEFLKGERFVIHPLGKGKTSWNYHAELLPWILQNASKYHTVIVHGLWQYHTYALSTAWKKLQSSTQLFVMPHGMLDPYFQNAPDRRLKALRNLVFWQLVEKNLIKAADGLLFTCEAEKQLARRPFSPYQPKAQHVVGLGVEHPPVYADSMRAQWLQECPQVRNSSYLLFLSRIDPKKGVDLLIAAYLKLDEATKRARKLVIAGPGLDTPFGKQMLEMAKDENNIIFVGMLTGLAKWGAFYGCDAFILPSHQENFGIAVVEAMACGKPVLISDKINIYKEIRSGRGGLICEDTEKGIYEMLTQWNNLEEQARQRYGTQAREVYGNCFSTEQASEALLAVLNLSKQP